MSEHNASGTRVMVRPLWVLLLLQLLTGPFYRLFWLWRANTDLEQFGRPRPGQLQRFGNTEGNGVASATVGAVAIIGWLLLSNAAFPWGSAADPALGDAGPSTTARIVLAAIGIALLIPGAITVLRTRRRIRSARELAGLAPDTRWTGWLFPVLLALELVAVPVWLFALQASLNDLWSHYPPLLDEDLHGQFAPPAEHDAAIARRPALHDARLARIADELEQPRTRPVVTAAFALLCVGVFVWQLIEHGPFPTADDVERLGGLRADIDGVWWRFWVSNVLHGSVEHIVGNLTVWIAVGTMVERVVGHARTAFIVVAGAAGCSAGVLVADMDVVSVGASGIVFAIVSVAVVLDPRARRSIGRFGWLMAVFGLGFSTFTPGISSAGHVGGFLAGIAIGLVLRLVWRPAPVPAYDPATLRSPVLDQTAPLAPDRRLTTQERLEHLRGRHQRGELDQRDFERLSGALLARG